MTSDVPMSTFTCLCFPGLLYDISQSYVAPFILLGLGQIAGGVCQVLIAIMRRRTRRKREHCCETVMSEESEEINVQSSKI